MSTNHALLSSLIFGALCQYEVNQMYLIGHRDIKNDFTNFSKIPTDYYSQHLFYFFSKFGVESKFLIVGDTNINLLLKNANSEKLKNLFSSFGMSHCNFDPTRITPLSKTLIDQVFSNISGLAVKTESVIFSDHESLICSLPLKVEINCNKPGAVRR
jgi:hypothetical protein